MNWDSLVSAVIGGVLAGAAAMLGVIMTDRHNRKLQADNDARILNGLLQALHDELDSLNERYQETMGAIIEALPDGNPLLWCYPVMQDFFTVYNANAFLIGRIEDNDLRRSVVRTYVLAKGLVDSFRMNNELFSKYEHWRVLAAETNSALHQRIVQAQYNSLVEYAKQIKQSHAEVKKSVAELMRMLHKHGVLYEA